MSLEETRLCGFDAELCVASGDFARPSSLQATTILRITAAQAGFSLELAEHARVEWRRVGFPPGTELADRYGVPDHLKGFTRLHVPIEWRDRFGKPIGSRWT